MKTYILGQAIVLTAALYDLNEVPLDASGIRLLVLPPSQAAPLAVPLALTPPNKVSGVFTPINPGIHRYRFESTSGLGAATEGEFSVEPRQVPAPI